GRLHGGDLIESPHGQPVADLSAAHLLDPLLDLPDPIGEARCALPPLVRPLDERDVDGHALLLPSTEDTISTLRCDGDQRGSLDPPTMSQLREETCEMTDVSAVDICVNLLPPDAASWFVDEA